MMLFDDFINRFLYRWQVGLQPEQDLSEIYWMVSYWVRDIVLLFNTFVMYLGFKFNEKQYRFFCSSCDSKCRGICVWSMDKKTKALQQQKMEQLKAEMMENESKEKNQLQADAALNVQTDKVPPQIVIRISTTGNKSVQSLQQIQSNNVTPTPKPQTPLDEIELDEYQMSDDNHKEDDKHHEGGKYHEKNENDDANNIDSQDIANDREDKSEEEP